ncbi:response regulator [Flavobacterium hercynium]|uniref:Response regulator n=1 Tax=Flavobacterium hercynium TaxID=387094 RepID=A0A226HHK6_9FLAO|nr:response regulator [Flavobacterium hercynium]OXA93156.1 response regulator [Flavobacterium hercynium]SMP32786.1 Response regulator receiver domain-containing protein [Flavobacterium hercynium]
MNEQKFNLLLADDDEDDCDFFKEALDELHLPISLVTVNDGVQLMDFLFECSAKNLPDVLFLDLNMPRKNGFECLTEIKKIDKLQHLPVIVFSTSLDMNIVDLMYEKGAVYYIRKPGDFSKLKKVIGNALSVTAENNYKQPAREHFILQP